MATAILQSLKHGAYTAIALYVVLIAVVTVVSSNPQLDAAFVQPSVIALEHAADAGKGRAS